MKTKKKTNTFNAGESIITGLREAIEWAEGTGVPARVHQISVPEVDVRMVRRKLALSQDEFARRYGFAKASVRNWEQGRRRPDGSARVLLAVIDKEPDAVARALEAYAN